MAVRTRQWSRARFVKNRLAAARARLRELLADDLEDRAPGGRHTVSFVGAPEHGVYPPFSQGGNGSVLARHYSGAVADGYLAAVTKGKERQRTHQTRQGAVASAMANVRPPLGAW